MLLAVADAAAESNILVFNAGATDDALRMEECRANVIHVAPSRTMLADALAQYLVRKNWTRWFLIVGSHPADEEYAAAIRRAAQRFGAEIVEERVFKDTGGARTTDSGLAQIEAQMAVFTQDAAGPSRRGRGRREPGLRAVCAVPHLDAGARRRHGRAAPDELVARRTTSGRAIQMQNRFVESSQPADDRQGHRILDRGAHRRRGGDAHQQHRSGRRSPSSSRARTSRSRRSRAQKLTLRDWDLQLRQPILLADGRMVVSVSPQEGFLHQTSTLDTLGYDRPETTCQL